MHLSYRIRQDRARLLGGQPVKFDMSGVNACSKTAEVWYGETPETFKLCAVRHQVQPRDREPEEGGAAR
jgi:hypothetical protein